MLHPIIIIVVVAYVVVVVLVVVVIVSDLVLVNPLIRVHEVEATWSRPIRRFRRQKSHLDSAKCHNLAQ